MGTTTQEIRRWCKDGINANKTHMIVVCDSFDYEDYPVFVSADEDSREVASHYKGQNMQRVMEVYNLKMDIEAQLLEGRVFNY